MTITAKLQSIRSSKADIKTALEFWGFPPTDDFSVYGEYVTSLRGQVLLPSVTSGPEVTDKLQTVEDCKARVKTALEGAGETPTDELEIYSALISGITIQTRTPPSVSVTDLPSGKYSLEWVDSGAPQHDISTKEIEFRAVPGGVLDTISVGSVTEYTVGVRDFVNPPRVKADTTITAVVESYIKDQIEWQQQPVDVTVVKIPTGVTTAFVPQPPVAISFAGAVGV